MKKSAVNAIYMGTLCAVAYLAVYIARNVLSVVTPQLINNGVYDEAFIGKLSSVYLIFYGVGQLINGVIGDKIKARWMISLGLLFAGATNFVFQFITKAPVSAVVIYGMTGFFLAMIYAPMTKVVAENTELKYATRCSLGYTFSSFLGSPIAGLLAAAMVWQSVFTVSSVALWVMAIVCFVAFLILERKGVVKYGAFKPTEVSNDRKFGNGVKVLIKHEIIKFSLVSILTGVVRTAVVFWLPTYFEQYLGYSEQSATLIFSITTFIISANAFIAIFVYERLRYNMDLTMFIMFATSAVTFFLCFVIYQPLLNIIFMVVAIISANCAATLLWSVYCPTLRETGMVSSATGFLDFLSYMAAALSSLIFGSAVSSLGWGKLILVWTAIMFAGVLISIPLKKKKIGYCCQEEQVDKENQEQKIVEQKENENMSELYTMTIKAVDTDDSGKIKFSPEKVVLSKNQHMAKIQFELLDGAKISDYTIGMGAFTVQLQDNSFIVSVTEGYTLTANERWKISVTVC